MQNSRSQNRRAKLAVLSVVGLVGLVGCRSTTSQILLLEGLSQPTAPHKSLRLSEDLTWRSTPLVPVVLERASVDPAGWITLPSPDSKRISDPGLERRRALTRLIGRDVVGWKRCRALATFAEVARTDSDDLTRALAINAMVGFVDRTLVEELGRGSAARPLTAEEQTETLDRLKAVQSNPELSSTSLEFLLSLPAPEQFQEPRLHAALLLLSEIARLGPGRAVRREATRLAELYGVRMTVVVLLSSLESPKARLRDDAARGLGELRISTASRELIACLQGDVSPVVRRSAAVALGQIGGDDAIDPLIRALERPREHVSVVLSVLRALREIAGSDAGSSSSAWWEWRAKTRPDTSDQSSQRTPLVDRRLGAARV